VCVCVCVHGCVCVCVHRLPIFRTHSRATAAHLHTMLAGWMMPLGPQHASPGSSHRQAGSVGLVAGQVALTPSQVAGSSQNALVFLRVRGPSQTAVTATSWLCFTQAPSRMPTGCGMVATSVCVCVCAWVRVCVCAPFAHLPHTFTCDCCPPAHNVGWLDDAVGTAACLAGVVAQAGRVGGVGCRAGGVDAVAGCRQLAECTCVPACARAEPNSGDSNIVAVFHMCTKMHAAHRCHCYEVAGGWHHAHTCRVFPPAHNALVRHKPISRAAGGAIVGARHLQQHTQEQAWAARRTVRTSEAWSGAERGASSPAHSRARAPLPCGRQGHTRCWVPKPRLLTPAGAHVLRTRLTWQAHVVVSQAVLASAQPVQMLVVPATKAASQAHAGPVTSNVL
jgi:hypothetical protein